MFLLIGNRSILQLVSAEDYSHTLVSLENLTKSGQFKLLTHHLILEEGKTSGAG